jgi:hypothetical protein
MVTILFVVTMSKKQCKYNIIDIYGKATQTVINVYTIVNTIQVGKHKPLLLEQYMVLNQFFSLLR